MCVCPFSPQLLVPPFVEGQEWVPSSPSAAPEGDGVGDGLGLIPGRVAASRLSAVALGEPLWTKLRIGGSDSGSKPASPMSHARGGMSTPAPHAAPEEGEYTPAGSMQDISIPSLTGTSAVRACLHGCGCFCAVCHEVATPL